MVLKLGTDISAPLPSSAGPTTDDAVDVRQRSPSAAPAVARAAAHDSVAFLMYDSFGNSLLRYSFPSFWIRGWLGFSP